MPIYYLDTSAIMKRYIPETGSHVVEELFDGLTDSDILATSYLTILEVNSTAMRLLRGRAITQMSYQNILDQLTHDITDYEVKVMPVQNELLDKAIGMVKNHSLRSLDAIHFASAIANRELWSSQNLYMISADREIVAACESHGILVVNPQTDDALDILRSLR